MQIVTLALHAGGNEFNMEPGWVLMKKLAQTGNIGRVAESDTDFITSLTTGETSVSFVNMGAWVNIAKSVPVVHLTKQDGMKVGLFSSGFVVLKNRPNKSAALKFINLSINPENSEIYASLAGEAPANVKAKSPPELAHMTFTKEEIGRFTYTPDWAYLSTQIDGWVKRWETEIVPLLRQG
jgi:putative spermidine/putrescine transport system substrate-binding protein